jgi:atlastin
MFLVRDWSYPYNHKYGIMGGREMLNKQLEINDKQHPDNQSLRRYIHECFEDISCFLMPHPGKIVATEQNFDGRLSDIDQEFKDNLHELIPLVLAPEHLVVKKIGGSRIKIRDLLYYFNSYLDIFSGDELPAPQSVFNATAEANNLSALSEAKDIYVKRMQVFCGGKAPYRELQDIKINHKNASYDAMAFFNNKKKMGSAEFSMVFRNQLEAFFRKKFDEFVNHNESKKSTILETMFTVAGTVTAAAFVIGTLIFRLL